jgi:phage N-6-adenine-methyltransferase
MTINKALFSSKNIEWETPQELFDELNKEFDFNTDICASPDNYKCDNFFTEKENSLSFDWGESIYNGKRLRIFLNPPYGRTIEEWVSKAWKHSHQCLVVCLLPARTDTKWWSIFWDRKNHKPKEGCQVRFLQGRLKFKNAKNSAPFPSAIVIFDNRRSLS